MAGVSGVVRQALGPGSLDREYVVRVGEGASIEGEAAAADAFLEVVTQLLEVDDALVEFGLPALGDALPVLPGRGAVAGEQREDLGDLGERDADSLGDPDHGDSAEGVAFVPSLVA